MMKKNFTSSVGQKFNSDGSAREFPGNTVLCHVSRPSKTFDLLLQVSERVKHQPWSKKFSFLPPSSYHMTIFDGVCDQVREIAHWTSQLPLDASLEQVDTLLSDAWQHTDKLQAFEMRYHRFYALGGYIGMYVVSPSQEVEQTLRDFRDLLAATFGIRHPDHAEYAFHITLAYGIEKLTFWEKLRVRRFSWQTHRWLKRKSDPLELKVPELTFFADMTCFAPTRPTFPPPASFYEL